jgi:hypothetical protein
VYTELRGASCRVSGILDPSLQRTPAPVRGFSDVDAGRSVAGAAEHGRSAARGAGLGQTRFHGTTEALPSRQAPPADPGFDTRRHQPWPVAHRRVRQTPSGGHLLAAWDSGLGGTWQRGYSHNRRVETEGPQVMERLAPRPARSAAAIAEPRAAADPTRHGASWYHKACPRRSGRLRLRLRRRGVDWRGALTRHTIHP